MLFKYTMFKNDLKVLIDTQVSLFLLLIKVYTQLAFAGLDFNGRYTKMIKNENFPLSLFLSLDMFTQFSDVLLC